MFELSNEEKDWKEKIWENNLKPERKWENYTLKILRESHFKDEDYSLKLGKQVWLKLMILKELLTNFDLSGFSSRAKVYSWKLSITKLN